MSLAPFVPTPSKVVTEMLELAELKRNETLFDLGCGDGRIIFEAAQKFGAKAVGVELNEKRYQYCVQKVQEARLEGRVAIIHGNLMDVDLKQADVVTLYLLTSSNKKVKPHLERDLKKGSRVVSHDFEIAGWKPTKIVKTATEIQGMGCANTFYSYSIENFELTPAPFDEFMWPSNFVSHTLYLYTI